MQTSLMLEDDTPSTATSAEAIRGGLLAVGYFPNSVYLFNLSAIDGSPSPFLLPVYWLRTEGRGMKDLASLWRERWGGICMTRARARAGVTTAMMGLG